MTNLGASAVWGIAIGLSLTAGAVVAARARLPSKVAELLTTFGGGILLAAIALELVPEADEAAGIWLTAVGLVGGTLVYVGADAWLTRDETMKRRRRMGHAMAAGRPMDEEMATVMRSPDPDHAEAARGESIAVGLFVDGVPESLALGLTVAAGEVGLALAAGILIGNVVESYGAAQPIIAGGHPKRFAIVLLGGIGLALAVSTVLGGTLLAGASPSLVGTAQAVAAGAILAVVSISIIPHAFAEVSREVAVGAVLGFTLGYLLS
jgi:zinc transporter, ZIP family